MVQLGAKNRTLTSEAGVIAYNTAYKQAMTPVWLVAHSRTNLSLGPRQPHAHGPASTANHSWSLTPRLLTSVARASLSRKPTTSLHCHGTAPVTTTEEASLADHSPKSTLDSSTDARAPPAAPAPRVHPSAGDDKPDPILAAAAAASAAAEASAAALEASRSLVIVAGLSHFDPSKATTPPSAISKTEMYGIGSTTLPHPAPDTQSPASSPPLSATQRGSGGAGDKAGDTPVNGAQQGQLPAAAPVDWIQRTSLLLGEDGLARLREARVLVVGLGGVGSYVAEFLVRRQG